MQIDNDIDELFAQAPIPTLTPAELEARVTFGLAGLNCALATATGDSSNLGDLGTMRMREVLRILLINNIQFDIAVKRRG